MAANERQEGGDHYKKLQARGMEPWDIIVLFNLDYLTGTAVKYLFRWKLKGGVEDLKKARHYIDKLIEVEEERARKPTSNP